MKRLISIILSAIVMLSSITAFAADNSFGIDVSEHNGEINYVQQIENGTSFVMIRLGYFNHLDKYFWQNVKAVSEAGINFGVYLYSYAYDLNEAQIEADFVLSTLAEMPEEYDKYFTMPVAYDVEDNQLVKFGKAQLTSQVELFCDAVNFAGYTPMVYANTTWFNNYLDANKFYYNGYKIWLADWRDNPSFSKQKVIPNTTIPADIWQYQSGSYHPSGLDQNVAFDMGSLMHKYTFVSDTKATCEKAGAKVFNCSICGEEKSISRPALGHNKKTYVTTKATTSATGKLTTKCTVCGKSLSTSTLNKIDTVTLSTTKYTYDGKAKKPTVTVKDSKGNKISSSYYDVTYSNNTKVGKATVKVTFKTRYSGTATKTFSVVPKTTSINTLTATKGGFKAAWTKQATQTTGYQIQIATNSAFSSGVKTYTVSSPSTTSKSVSSLTKGKKYYVRIRTYKTVSSTKYYSAWSSYKTVTTKK